VAGGPGLKIDIAEKRFPGASTQLYQGLRFDVVPGQVLGLVGPSGVGKSTLLRLLAGIDAQFTGSITIDGIAATNAPPAGFVFQDPRLLPWLTALDNIRAANPACTRELALEALRLVGLDDAAHLYPRQLSGGMQRRVALARALAVNARLLLLDEPLVSLDRIAAGEMLALLGSLIAAEQPTVILVSHLPEDVARLAHRAICLFGRPARIGADLDFPVPPAERDTETVAQYRALLEQVAS
jgi:ABC-type nitrate/sulfonate/bicarbonate transport system ATPase subunit